MRKARLFLVGASALTLWGCGGGNGPVGASDPLTSGRAALTQLATNTSSPSTQALRSALTLFQQALKQNPNSSLAHFGAAVCLMGADAQQVDGGTVFSNSPPTTNPTAAGVNKAGKSAGTRDAGSSPGSVGSGFVLPASPTTGDVPPAPPNGTVITKPIEPVHTLGLFWFLDRGLSNPNTLLNMLAPISDLHLGLISFYGYAGDATAVANRQKLLADLATVAQNLQAVEADPNFTMTLPAPDQNGQTVTIGLPEVYLFDAYVQSLRVSTALSLAYNRDPGNAGLVPPPVIGGGGSAPMPPAPPIFVGASRAPAAGGTTGSPFTALDTNGDGKLEPNEYLPPSPFLTLRDPSYLQTAQTAMQSIVDRETKGIAGVLARPATGNFLVPNSTDVAAALNSISTNVLPLILQASTGPVTLNVPLYQAIPLVATNGGGTVHPVAVSNELFETGAVTTATFPPGTDVLAPPYPVVTTQKLTIDIAAWFAHPPADLKVFAPTYTLDSIGYPNYSLTTYPDLTFGGLFPNGLPSDLQL